MKEYTATELAYKNGYEAGVKEFAERFDISVCGYLTDNEVIKELQHASEWFEKHGRNTNTAIIGICDRAVDLINRQKAEIERLEKANERFAKEFDSYYATVKSQAIKEFAERLKEKSKMPLGTLYGKIIYVKDIDSLVEEMTEDEGK